MIFHPPQAWLSRWRHYLRMFCARLSMVLASELSEFGTCAKNTLREPGYYASLHPGTRPRTPAHQASGYCRNSKVTPYPFCVTIIQLSSGSNPPTTSIKFSYLVLSGVCRQLESFIFTKITSPCWSLGPALWLPNFQQVLDRQLNSVISCLSGVCRQL